MPMIRFRELLPLYGVVFLGFLGYALTITLYIPMLMDKSFSLLPIASSASLRLTLSGLLLAMYPLGQFFGSPIVGNLSDYYGRKNILLLSLLASALGFTAIALSIQVHCIIWLFISSFLTGLCESNMAISQSVIADKSENNLQKIKFIGYAYSACSLGYVVGPLLGGSGGRLGYSGPFWITAVGVLSLAACILWGFRDDYVPNKKNPIKIFQTIIAIKSIFNQPKFYKFYLINFLIFFSVQGLYRVVPLYVVDKWQPSLLTYSLLISYVSLLCLIANLFILEKLAKRFSTQSLLKGLLLLGGLLVVLIIVPAHFSWIWLTYAVAVMPTVMALPTCTTWLSQHADSAQQGQVLGNNQALLVLGESSSAAVGGLIAALMVSLPVLVMGIILLITGIVVMNLTRRTA